MDDVVRFLLPPGAPVFLCTIINGVIRPLLVQDSESLVATVAASAHYRSVDAYMSVAGFDPSGEVDSTTGHLRRTGNNARFFKSVVFDADIDPSGVKHADTSPKPCYRTKDEAYAAFLRVCAATGLTVAPIVLDSGRGLHFWWTFDRVLDAVEWHGVAARIKAAVLTDPVLAVDTTRVSDRAGIIRLPGSLNTKSGTYVHPYTGHQSTFTLLDYHTVVDAISVAVASRAEAYSGGPTGAGGTSLASMSVRTTVPLATLFTSCAVLGAAALDPSRFGNDQYTALASACATAPTVAEGVAALNAIMRPDPNWDEAKYPAENLKFIERGHAERRDPLRCASLVAKFPHLGAHCHGCALYIERSARLAAGQDTTAVNKIADAYAAKVKAENAAIKQAQATPAVPSISIGGTTESPTFDMAMFSDKPRESAWEACDGVPPPFLIADMNRAGVYKGDEGDTIRVDFEPNPEGEGFPPVRSITTLIKGRVLWLESSTATSAKSTDESTKRAYVTLGMMRKTTSGWERRFFEMPAAKLASDASLAEALTPQGIVLHHNASRTAVRRVLGEQLTGARNANREVVGAQSMGWCSKHDIRAPQGFVAAGCLIDWRNDPVIRPVRYEAAASGLLDDARMRTTNMGGLSIANNLLTTYAQFGSDEAKFIIAAALASPLLCMTDVMGILVGMTGRSGLGKTALLSLVSSIWGFKTPNLSPKDTPNSQSAILAALQHVPGTIDEITLMDGDSFSELAYSVTLGRDKHRLDSNSALRDPGTRTSILFATSNIPPHELITARGAAGDAQRARILDVEITQSTILGITQESAAHLRAMTEDCRGWIGVLTASYYVKNRDAIIAAVQSTRAAMASPNPAHRFIDALGACTLVASRTLGAVFPGWTVSEQDMTSIIDRLRQRSAASADAFSIVPEDFVTEYMTLNAASAVVLANSGGKWKELAWVDNGAPKMRVELPDSKAGVITVHIPEIALNAHCRQLSLNPNEVRAALYSEKAKARGFWRVRGPHKVDLYGGSFMPTGADGTARNTLREGFGPTPCHTFYIRDAPILAGSDATTSRPLAVVTTTKPPVPGGTL